MKNVLITGGSRGIGAELTRRFSAEGYRVFFFYRSDGVSAASVGKETGAFGFCCDVADEKAVTEAFDRIGSLCTGIDILVNNAGVSLIKPINDTTCMEWHRMLSVTLDGAFYCVNSALPHMIHEKWGRIINITSIWGDAGASCEVAYSTAKAGLTGFTKALSKELAPSGITVNSVSPGFIDTDMNSDLSEDERSDFISGIPIGRAGTPFDVANAVLFLAKEESSYITGQSIRVNGGLIT